ncbi:hypothetical protein MTR_2g012340 [Medicago truncatula]|uniref:Uncharacterized protein n=1 Tax=Medicago truncatula TaxID=3880 RepID=G7ILE1_MEDTR|nr:hypothetical protein MTR_2g012340 [Medicago truncatula]
MTLMSYISITNNNTKVLPCKECIEALCAHLSNNDPILVEVCLRGLEHFLFDGKTKSFDIGVDIYAKMIENLRWFTKDKRLSKESQHKHC